MIAPELDHHFEQLAWAIELPRIRRGAQLAQGLKTVRLDQRVLDQLPIAHRQRRKRCG